VSNIGDTIENINRTSTSVEREYRTLPGLPTSAGDYQSRRLRLGIAGVGAGTCIAAAIVVLVLYSSLGQMRSGVWVAVGLGSSVALVMAVLQSLLDASGRRLDRQFGLISGRRSVVEFNGVIETVRWSLSFVTGCAITAMCVVYGGVSWPWLLIALAGIGVSLRLLSRGRPAGVEVPTDAKWFGEVQTTFALNRMAGIEAVIVIDIGEKTLAGGRCGWLGRRLWVSRAVAELKPSLAATLIARELAHTENRYAMKNAGISFVILALSIGLAFGLLSWVGQSATLHAPSVVLLLSSIVTLWSFASLFVLPAIGRSQVIAVDRWIARHFGVDAALAMLDALTARNLPNQSLDRAKAYVFHPIPTMSARRESVETVQAREQRIP